MHCNKEEEEKNPSSQCPLDTCWTVLNHTTPPHLTIRIRLHLFLKASSFYMKLFFSTVAFINFLLLHLLGCGNSFRNLKKITQPLIMWGFKSMFKRLSKLFKKVFTKIKRGWEIILKERNLLFIDTQPLLIWGRKAALNGSLITTNQERLKYWQNKLDCTPKSLKRHCYCLLY